MEKISKGEKNTIQNVSTFWQNKWCHMKGKEGTRKQLKKPKHFLYCIPLQAATQPPSSPEKVNGQHGMPLFRLPTSWLTWRHVCGSALITKVNFSMVGEEEEKH